MRKSYRREWIEKLDGCDRLYERDALSILLSNAYGGKDMSALADALLSRFPSIRAVLSAELNQLCAVEGMEEKVALYLKTLGIAVMQMEEEEIVIKDAEDFLRVVAKRFRGRDNEYAEFYLVNAKGKAIFVKTFTSNSADKVSMQTDEVLQLIAVHRPHGVYLAHNHVNCASRPSAADDDITRRILLAGAACGTCFCDHAIVNSDGETFSYALSGRLAQLKAECGL